MADAEVTAHILLRMQQDVRERFAEALCKREVSHALLAAMQRAACGALGKCVERELSAAA